MTANRGVIRKGDVVMLRLLISRRISPLRTVSAETIESVYAAVEYIDLEGQEVVFKFTKYEFGETTLMYCRMDFEDVEAQTGRKAG